MPHRYGMPSDYTSGEVNMLVIKLVAQKKCGPDAGLDDGGILFRAAWLVSLALEPTDSRFRVSGRWSRLRGSEARGRGGVHVRTTSHLD